MKTNKMSAIFSNQHEYDELLPLTEERALSTLYFAGKYRLMDFPLSSIANAGIKSVYTLINARKVRSYFDHLGGGKEWGFDKIGSYEYMDFYQRLVERQKAGKPYYNEVIEFLKKAENPYTVFIGNKMIGNFDLKAVLHYHKLNNNKITGVFKKTTKENTSSADEIFKLDQDGRIAKNIPAAEVADPDSYNLSANVYIADTDWIIEKLEKIQASGEPVNIAHQLAKLAAQEKSVAYEYTGYLRNVYDVKSYYDANMDMLEAKKRDSLLYGSQKIITRVRNEVGTYYCQDSDIKESMVATGCNICGNLHHSVISRLVTVDSNSDISKSIVMANSHIKEGSRIENAIIDKNVTIGPNVTIKGTANKPVVIKKNSVITEDIVNK